MDGDDRNTVPSAKRQRGGARLHETSELTEADAADLAMCLRNNSFKKHQGGLTLLPADAPVVQRYSAARRQLQKTCSDLALVGFRLFGPCDHILNDADAQRILDFCKTISWEPRRGSQGRHLQGTERKNFGVDMDDRYRVLPGSTGKLPQVLDELGKRVIKHCCEQQWPFSKAPVSSTLRFEQAYVQKYPPATKSLSTSKSPSSSLCDPSCSHSLSVSPVCTTSANLLPMKSPVASTLGFHFDGRSAYGELICGVTISGSGKLLLGSTNGTEFIQNPKKTMAAPNVSCVQLVPRTVYAMSGLSRYDLRHAVVNDGDEERISVTFRSVNWSQVTRIAPGLDNKRHSRKVVMSEASVVSNPSKPEARQS